MKRVLILCYYFPPCNGAPAWRPYSWVLNFHKFGIHPVIITRHWNGSENTWHDFLLANTDPPRLEKHAHYDVLFVPSAKMKLNKILEKYTWLGKIFGNLYFFILAVLGRFNTEIDVYLAYKDILKEHLKNNVYDAVIVSSPPSNILELIKVVKDNSKAVIIADIRDLWNNLMLTVPYKPGLKQKVWDYFYSSYYKKWLRHVDLITVIIEPFADILKTLSTAPVKVVYNGFESTLFNQLKKTPTEKFVFSVIGNIYPEQDMRVMLEGLKLFLRDKSPDQVSVRFIGASSLPKVAAIIQSEIPSEYLIISGRVSKQQALQETLDAHVLSFCGWKGVKGMISTKAFDYIASGNYVLIAPGDEDALDRLILECECGSSVNSPAEFEATLNALFRQWKADGSLPEVGNKEKIEFYSREHQAMVMSEHINDLIAKGRRAS